MANADQESNGLMRIGVFVDPRWIWRWHKWLVEALQARGHQVDIFSSGVACDMPAKLRLLLQMEKLVYRHKGGNASEVIALAEFDPQLIRDKPARAGYDLVMDLAGNTRLQALKCRRFRPLYDGLPGDADLIGQLMDGQRPRLALDDSALPEPRRFGLCAVERPDVVLKALNNVYSRVAEALLKAVDEIADNLVSLPPDSLSGARTEHKRGRKIPVRPGPFFVGGLGSKISNRLAGLVRSGPRWGVGWRFTDGHPARDANDLLLSNYQLLPDDGQRFYADPFVIWHEGRHHLFVGDFPYRHGKGHISHFTIEPDGTVSAPQMVLSRPYHLSYPFVFRHQGSFFMIPETSSNRAVELYRAVSFPDKWILEKTLLNDMRLDDVTLLQTDERWWMFAATSNWQTSAWDALALFSADDLFADWKPHASNPVLLDARAARPAGNMYQKDGVLYRPAQDCSSGYGAGIALCRVERLDEEGYEQSVITRFQPQGDRRLCGLHTLNEDHGLEVIDFYGRI